MEKGQLSASPLMEAAVAVAALTSACDAALKVQLDGYRDEGYKVQVIPYSRPGAENGEPSMQQQMADAYTRAVGSAGASRHVLIVPAPRRGRAVMYRPDTKPSGVTYLGAQHDPAHTDHFMQSA